MTDSAIVGRRLDRFGYELEVDERFDGPELDRRLWIPHYLPHWSSREVSAARYRLLEGGALELRIEADQPAWNPAADGELRVSSLQTALVPGQFGFREDLMPGEPQPEVVLYAPRYGLLEVCLRASADPTLMVALWLIGLEQAPGEAGEICVVEIFGRDVDLAAGTVAVGMGVHPQADPSLADDFARVVATLDPREPHWYAAAWGPAGVTFFIDDVAVRDVPRGPSYPIQLMLGLYEFRGDGAVDPSAYPKTVVVERVRGWRPVAGPAARPVAFPTGTRWEL